MFVNKKVARSKKHQKILTKMAVSKISDLGLAMGIQEIIFLHFEALREMSNA